MIVAISIVYSDGNSYFSSFHVNSGIKLFEISFLLIKITSELI